MNTISNIHFKGNCTAIVKPSVARRVPKIEIVKEEQKAGFITKIKDLFSNKPKDKTIKLLPDKQNEYIKNKLNFNFHIKEGETFGIGDKLFVNNNGKLQILNITPEKFQELFPSKQAKQNKKLGDCWLISVLNGLMNRPKGRIKIYENFTQNWDNIYVKAGDKNILFSRGNLPKSKAEKNLQGPKGLQMIEQAAAVRRTLNITNDIEKGAESIGIDTMLENLNGGFQIDALRLISPKLKPKMISFNDGAGQEYAIKKYANKSNSFLGLTTLPNFMKKHQPFGGKILPTHGHVITGYDKKTKMVSLQDPFKPDKLIQIEIDELMKYPFSLTHCKLD